MRRVAVVGLVMALSCGGAGAKSLDDVTGPAEPPPKGYAGNQYIDSEGCVFLRAGYAGEVTWVPRVDRNRNLICGKTPTFGKNAAAEVKPVTVAKVDTIPFEKSGCNFAPEMVQRFTLSDGRTFMNCGDAIGDPVAYLNGMGRADLKVTGPAPVMGDAPVAAAAPNPEPVANTVAPAPAPEPAAVAAKPVVPEGSGTIFIQVGAFGVAGNAEKAVGTLADAGVPASARPGKMQGKVLDFVVAGPFASQDAAADALRIVRRQGFPDAFIK